MCFKVEKVLLRKYQQQDNSHDLIIPEWIEVFRWDKIPIGIRTVSDDILKKKFLFMEILVEHLE